ncbi:MAG: CFI-box-CTERM domain-containing protein, partial [Planctomycetota bacterium]
IYLSRYDGRDVRIWDNDIKGWTTTFANGDPIDTGTTNDAARPELRIDSNDVVYVTYMQSDGTNNHLYLSRVAADSDGDGTLDYNDGCPNDSNKTAVGICGCGVADTDSDTDGTEDCNDAFPSNPNEWLDTDSDGIGNNADTDDDNDGMPDSYEVQHGMDPLTDDASGDIDGDGFNNLQEYLAGTGPGDNADSPEPDFGDAHDPDYISLAVNSGASHLVSTNEWLCNDVDSEADSIQVDADLFDDGVIFKSVLLAGVPTDVDVTVTVANSMDPTRYDPGDPQKRLYLNAWFDWNADGDWDDPGEKVIGTGSGIFYPGYADDTVVIDPGIEFGGTNSALYTFAITPPVDWAIGGYARFRLDYGEDGGAVQNISGNLSGYTGAAQYGEVEDYRNPLLACSAIDDVNGGTLAVDGSGGELDGCQVHIPAAALNAPTFVTIQDVQNAEDLPNTPEGGIQILLEIGPTGTIFNTPITVTVPHDPSLVHSDSPQPYFWDEVNGQWSTDGISNVVYDESSDPHIVTFDATHLTVFAVGMGTPAVADDSGGGGGGSGCFIATAAYGSAFDLRVELLREFRDHFLLTNSVGNAFVEFYYRHSPASADFIAKHSNLRAIVRLGLLPIVGMSWVFLKLGFIPTVALMFLFGYGLICMIRVRKKYRN